jgi:hypothetical protein
LGACDQHKPFLRAICRALPQTPRIDASVITQALRAINQESKP